MAHNVIDDPSQGEPERYVHRIDWTRVAKRQGDWRKDPYLRALFDPSYRAPYRSAPVQPDTPHDD